MCLILQVQMWNNKKHIRSKQFAGMKAAFEEEDFFNTHSKCLKSL